MDKIEFSKLEKKEDMQLAFNQLKDDYHILFERHEKLKEVIEEVREIINKMVHYGYEENGTYYMRTTDNSEFGTRAEVLLQILDKAKENK